MRGGGREGEGEEGTCSKVLGGIDAPVLIPSLPYDVAITNER